MSALTLEILEIIAKYLGHIIAFVCIVQIYIIYYIKRHEFFTDLRGKDLKWQLIEISAISWYILFPALVVVSILGIDINIKVWGAMDTVYLMNLGFKRYDTYLKHKYPLNERDINKKDNTNEEAD